MNKQIIYCKTRAEWREWLEKNFESADEIWFTFPTKESGEVGVAYNDAVEEALCFNWIDGKAGTLDERHHIRRFTPRRKGSTFSQPNIERLIWLDRHNMIHPKVKATIESVISKPFTFPEDILDTIKQDETAWKNYQAFSEPYKRIRVAYINAARKRPKEFTKRLNNFISQCRQNKIITGYGGVEKYYK